MELLNIPLDLIDLSDLNVRKDLRAGTEDATQDDLVESIRDKRAAPARGDSSGG